MMTNTTFHFDEDREVDESWEEIRRQQDAGPELYEACQLVEEFLRLTLVLNNSSTNRAIADGVRQLIRPAMAKAEGKL